MTELPDTVLEAFEDTNFWHIATVNPDGSPQSTPVWVARVTGRSSSTRHSAARSPGTSAATRESRCPGTA